MYSDEQLIRDFLSELSSKEIDNSIHLINIDFERDSFDDIMDAILSLYLDVAETAKKLTNGNGDDNIVREQETKMQILNKLLDYEPITNALSKKLKSQSEQKVKQAS